MVAAGAAASAEGGANLFGQAPAVRPASQYPLFAAVDVPAAGGGPAGIGAALGAARAGAKTLLVENHSFFGGVAAWALGMPINQVRPGGKPRSAIHELLIRKLAAYGDQAVRMGTHELWCNVEYLKVAVLDALDEAGVPLPGPRARGRCPGGAQPRDGRGGCDQARIDDRPGQGGRGLHGRCRRGVLRRGRDHDRPCESHAHDPVAGLDQYR